MPRGYAAALAGIGLVLFIAAGFLFAGGLSSFTAAPPDEPAPPPADGPVLAYDPHEIAAGGLFLLRPDAGTPPDWAARLAGQGVTVGSATGDGAYLVRIPATVLDGADLPGAALEPYPAAERLAAGLGAAGDAEVQVTISLFDPADKPAAADRVQSLDGTILRGLDEAEGAALRARLPADRLEELAAAPEVVYVEHYTPPERLNDRARDVVAAAPVNVPGFLTPAGLAGAGQIVALADSGVDKGSMSDVHPDLASTPGLMPKIVYISPFSGGEPSDPIGHGTHMAASIAGTGAASGGLYRGVAPQAGLFIQSILNPEGRLDPPADLVTLFRPAYEAGARVHANGWGGRSNTYLGAASQVDRFVRYYPNFLVVFGAGNNGPNEATLTPEANSKNALVVGASQNPRPAFGPDSSDAGDLASFSSRGPTGDGRLKPDLVVPGSAVVSAKSSLIEGNFTAHPEYTRMQGTSMAAALAGGAAALTREYLQKHADIPAPTAALVKAVLINGARPLDGPYPSPGSGFGLLDLTGTLLALREETFLYNEGDTVASGERRTYTFQVTHADAPFKATLAWTDPPAVPGAARTLVNDLDLRVVGPDGTEYRGNDFQGAGQRDDRNNVEQVFIPDPAPGEYAVIVEGAAVSRAVRDGTSRPTQDFAVVFGQPLARHIAAGGDQNRLVLDDGTGLDLSGRTVTSLVNDKPAFPRLPAGADVYLAGPEADPAAGVHLVAREGEVAGVKALPAQPDQSLLVRINSRLRTGGYYVAPGRPAVLNGRPLDDPADIPAGADVRGSLNPSTQTVWQLEAEYREVRGVLASIDHDNGRLRLLNDHREYTLGREAAVGLTRTVIGGDRGDRPFGAAVEGDPRHLYPGVDVRLVLSRLTGRVSYLAAEQYVVVGTLREDPGEAGTITFADGRRYAALPGITVERDGRTDGLAALRAGDLVFAAVVPGEKRVLGITAHSTVRYGRVVYAGAQSLYLSDYRGELHTLRLTGRSRVFRWDLTGDAALLSPGLMVRVTLASGTREVLRVDVAESVSREIVVVDYDRGAAVLHAADGESYPVAAGAAFDKNGFPVSVHDLLPGETVTLTVLSGPGGTVAVRGSAIPQPEAEAPALRVASVVPLSDRYIVSGTTTADRLYAWLGEPAFDRLELTADGDFYWAIPYGAGADQAQLVAVDTRTGGVAGRQVTLPAAPAESALGDITGSWARDDIARLVSRGLISGYPDGTFRPDRPVTRAEFTVLLARLLGLPGERDPELPFTDAASVPDWARDRIALAHHRGLVDGYDDGAFRPDARISRVEAAAILVRGCAVLGIDLPEPAEPASYADWTAIPEWGRDSVTRARAAGLMRGRADDRFAPGADLSRAETAAVLNRLLQMLE